MQQNKPTLYQALIANGIACSNWQSDLYFVCNEKTREILKSYPDQTKSVFKSNIDGQIMYDCAFAFDPFWESRKGIA